MNKPWAFFAIFVVIIVSWLVVQHQWNEALSERYNTGVNDGKQSVKDEYENKAALLRNNWSIDKGVIEYEAQQRIKAISSDAANARLAVDGLQQTLDKIRSIVSSSGVAVTSSTSTGKAVDLLADLLIQSNRRANTYAEFADRAYEAGRTCEIQYDKLRDRAIEQASK